MNNVNRVLLRRGARDLSTQEMEQVVADYVPPHLLYRPRLGRRTETFLSAEC